MTQFEQTLREAAAAGKTIMVAKYASRGQYHTAKPMDVERAIRKARVTVRCEVSDWVGVEEFSPYKVWVA